MTLIYHAGNNPEEISVWQSDAALPRDFLLKFYFDLKMPKMISKQEYSSINNYHLLNEVPFYNSKCLFFCSSGCCPMILDYSLSCLSNSVKKQNKLVNADLKHLFNCLNANKISLNEKKTEMVIFEESKRNLKVN